jgi:hypothetical protein
MRKTFVKKQSDTRVRKTMLVESGDNINRFNLCLGRGRGVKQSSTL